MRPTTPLNLLLLLPLLLLLLLLACCGAVRAAADTGGNEGDKETAASFRDWAQRHGRTYATAAEREAALSNFRGALRRVQEINQGQDDQGQRTWWAAPTRLSDRSPEELRRTLLPPVDPAHQARHARELELGRRSACPLGARTCAVESQQASLPQQLDWRASARVTPA
jgi:hypothetical protein